MSVIAQGSLTARPTSRAGTKVGYSDPVVLYGRAIAHRIKVTIGITGLSPPRVHIDGEVWHLDVGSSHPGAVVRSKGWVFGKQLLGPILCGSIARAPLLPKLRGQFAEFLNYPSPAGLRILFLSTCVGLRYGRLLLYTKLFSPYATFTSLLLFQSLAPGSTIARVKRFVCVPLFKL